MSKKMRKFISLVLLVGLTTTAFVLSNSAYGETTLKVLVSEYPATRAQEELKQEFEQQTGIKVEYTFLPWEGAMNKVKLTAATRDSTYDIVAYDALMASIFLPMEGFEPLDPYIEDSSLPDIDVDGFVPDVIDYYGFWNNQVVGVPFYYADRIAVYRKDWFEDPVEKANFMDTYGYDLPYPRTWDQFRDVCEFFTRDTDGDGKPDRWGTTKGYMRMIIWDEWADLYESFAPIEDDKWHVNDEMEPIFENEKAFRAVDYLVDITKSGFVKPGYMEMEWGDSKPMTTPLNWAFHVGKTLGYEYDFGSTTELKIKAVGERTREKTGDTIVLLARNTAPKIPCGECDAVAKSICPYCSYDASGWLCKKCMKKHERECEGGDMALPVVNSPRAGVCGYVG